MMGLWLVSAYAFLCVSRGQLFCPPCPTSPCQGLSLMGQVPFHRRPILRPALHPHPGPAEALPCGQIHGRLSGAALLRGRPAFPRRRLLRPGLHPRQPVGVHDRGEGSGHRTLGQGKCQELVLSVLGSLQKATWDGGGRLHMPAAPVLSTATSAGQGLVGGRGF